MLVLAPWCGILERMAGDPAASKIIRGVGELRAPPPWAGDGYGVAAAFVAGGEDDIDFVARGVAWGG